MQLPRLMLVTDRRRTRGRPLVPLVVEAARGGVGLVQLREKDLGDAELRRLAEELLTDLPAEVRLVINGRPAIARELGIGLHLAVRDPQTGGDERPGKALLGRSVHDLDETRAALADRPDYLVAGPAYATVAKPGHPGAGAGWIETVAAAAGSVAVFAIGGVTVSGIPPLIHAGAWGVAVCGALVGANDPRRLAEGMSLALSVAAT